MPGPESGLLRKFRDKSLNIIYSHMTRWRCHRWGFLNRSLRVWTAAASIVNMLPESVLLLVRTNRRLYYTYGLGWPGDDATAAGCPWIGAGAWGCAGAWGYAGGCELPVPWSEGSFLGPLPWLPGKGRAKTWMGAMTTAARTINKREILVWAMLINLKLKK